MNIKRYNIKIKFRGFKTLIPVIDVGKCDKYFITLVAQLHGDEFSSRLILNEIVGKKNEISSDVRLILCANPIGARISNKFEPISDINLNRNFISSNIFKPNNISDILSRILISLCKGSKLVIDLHDMPGSDLPICSIVTKTENLKINKLNISYVERFGPNILWLEDFSDPNIEKRYKGTINNYLNSIGIPNFSIELKPIERLDPKTTSMVVKKILSLINSKNIKDNNMRMIERKEIYSPANGVFIPSQKNIFDNVNKNDELGTILTTDLKEVKVISPVSGTLIRIAYQQFVRKEQKIIDIGKEVLWKDQ